MHVCWHSTNKAVKGITFLTSMKFEHVTLRTYLETSNDKLKIIPIKAIVIHLVAKL